MSTTIKDDTNRPLPFFCLPCQYSLPVHLTPDHLEELGVNTLSISLSDNYFSIVDHANMKKVRYFMCIMMKYIVFISVPSLYR